jgi:hypothetical protein
MGSLFVRCPITHEAISTGIETDPESLAKMRSTMIQSGCLWAIRCATNDQEPAVRTFSLIAQAPSADQVQAGSNTLRCGDAHYCCK